MKLLAAAALCAAATLVPSAAGSPRSGNLHATKDCTGFDGAAGSYCMITSSSLPAIEVGSKILYLQPAALLTPQASFARRCGRPVRFHSSSNQCLSCFP